MSKEDLFLEYLNSFWRKQEEVTVKNYLKTMKKNEKNVKKVEKLTHALIDPMRKDQIKTFKKIFKGGKQ